VVRTDPPVFFVSYARADAEYPQDRADLKTFVEDLSARVARALTTPLKGVCFIDTDMQAGEVWTDPLGDALMRCRVGLALYTPNYFARPWCGKEFQVLLDRRGAGRGGTGIVPLRWGIGDLDPPKCASDLQYDTGSFPPEYTSIGMQQLVRLRSVQLAQYEAAMNVVAARVVAEAKAERLMPLAQLDFDAVTSAWDESTANDALSHTRGNISKACFVYISHRGWGWTPYQGMPPEIGAMTQVITGDLRMRWEEIPYNAALPQKLMEAYENHVPTILIGDPQSLLDEAYARPMRQYDALYLLNCAALVAWEPEAKGALEADPRWTHLKTRVFQQKIEKPPAFHELNSIFSRSDLDQKTRMLIEQIRSGLLKLQLMANPGSPGAARRAEDTGLSQGAAEQGIITGSTPNLEGPTR
jgi:TIR domain